MAKVNTKKVNIEVISVNRTKGTCTQVRWLGQARPTDEDKAELKAHGFRFYAKDDNGPCWASYRLGVVDTKNLLTQRGYNIPDTDDEVVERNKQVAKQTKSKSKAQPKAETKTTKTTKSKAQPKAEDDEMTAKYIALGKAVMDILQAMSKA